MHRAYVSPNVHRLGESDPALAPVINVAASTDRMDFQRRQLAALGVEFERMETATPETLDSPSKDAVWRSWQRPPGSTEMASFASRMAAWKRVIELGAPCLILGDDAMLATDTPKLLEEVEVANGIDHVHLETAGRKKILARRLHPSLPLHRLIQDSHGACGYVIFPSGARLLHTRSLPAPADAAISSEYALRSWQADPAFAAQLEMAPRYGLVSPINVSGLVNVDDRPDRNSPPAHEARRSRRRRILCQTGMALRMLVRVPWNRREVVWLRIGQGLILAVPSRMITWIPVASRFPWHGRPRRHSGWGADACSTAR